MKLIIALGVALFSIQSYSYTIHKIKRAKVDCQVKNPDAQDGDLKIRSVRFTYNVNATPQVRVGVKYSVAPESNLQYTIKNCRVDDEGASTDTALATFEIRGCEMDSGEFFRDDPELRVWFWYEGKSGNWRNGSGTIAYAGLFNNIDMSCRPIGNFSTYPTVIPPETDDRTDDREISD